MSLETSLRFKALSSEALPMKWGRIYYSTTRSPRYDRSMCIIGKSYGDIGGVGVQTQHLFTT